MIRNDCYTSKARYFMSSGPPCKTHFRYVLKSKLLKSTAYFVGVEYFAIACGTNEGKLFFN